MINSVVLTGRLTNNIEVKRTSSNKEMASFSIAVNRRFTQPNQPQADFINCVAFGKVVEILQKYTTKGAMIGVEGAIQTSSYEKNGQTFRNTQVLVSNITLLSHNKNSNETNQSYVNNSETIVENQSYSNEKSETTDDDLPF